MEKTRKVEKGLLSWVALISVIAISIAGAWAAWTEVDGEMLSDLFVLLAFGIFICGVICGTLVLFRSVIAFRERRWYLSFVLLIWAATCMYLAWVFLGILVGWTPYVVPLNTPLVQGNYIRPAMPFILVFPTITLLEVSG